MANTNKPSGFTPVGHLNGSSWNGVTHTYAISSTSANLAVGDIVKSYGQSESTGKYLEVLRITTASDQPIGVVTAIHPYLPVSSSKNIDYLYYPTGQTGWFCSVCDSPDIIMEAQIDGAPIAADFGLNIQPTVTAVDTTSGVSQMQLDESTAETTSTHSLHLHHLVDRPDNELGIYAKCLCSWNIHELMHGVTAT